MLDKLIPQLGLARSSREGAPNVSEQKAERRGEEQAQTHAKERRRSAKNVTEIPVERGESSANDGREYVLERLRAHGTNEDAEHRFAAVGESMYLVRWEGFEADGDTWEPISHIPRSKVVSYHRTKRSALPKDLHKAQVG